MRADKAYKIDIWIPRTLDSSLVRGLSHSVVGRCNIWIGSWRRATASVALRTTMTSLMQKRMSWMIAESSIVALHFACKETL